MSSTIALVTDMAEPVISNTFRYTGTFARTHSKASAAISARVTQRIVQRPWASILAWYSRPLAQKKRGRTNPSKVKAAAHLAINTAMRQIILLSLSVPL